MQNSFTWIRSKTFSTTATMSIHTSSKKRKVSSPAVEKTASKKAKHAVSDAKKESTKKGKTRETEFQVIQATLLLSISPVFTSNPRAGVDEMLDSMIMRCAALHTY